MVNNLKDPYNKYCKYAVISIGLKNLLHCSLYHILGWWQTCISFLCELLWFAQRSLSSLLGWFSPHILVPPTSHTCRRRNGIHESGVVATGIQQTDKLSSELIFS